MTPLCLAIVVADEQLSAVLSDQRSLVRLGRQAWDPAVMPALMHQGQVLRLEADSAQRAEAICGLGQRLFALLPPVVGEQLRRSAPRSLRLQLGPGLELLPWEIAHDGEEFLGEKFDLSRLLLQDDEPAAEALRVLEDGVLNVLLLVDGEQAGARADALEQAMAALPALRVRQVRSDGLSAPALAELMAACHVLHGLGAALARPDPAGPGPMLCVSECEDPPWALCRAGADVLLHRASAQDLPFIQRLYGEWLKGAPLAEGLRRARVWWCSAAPGHRPDLLGTACYGGGDLSFRISAAADDADHKRQLTIMSYDLVGSTRLLASLGPERYSELLDAYHERCVTIAAYFGGVPDDPQGDDGIMCYFGLPFASEDAAAQAVRAGLAIIDAVAKLGLAVRVGVSSGQVVMRAGQPVGVDVHLAARLQSIADPGVLLVSESTRRLVRQDFEFLPWPEVPALKGIDSPGPVHAVRQAPTREPSEAQLGLRPLIGREAELARLLQAWGRSSTRLQLLQLVGDAGIGKSRLVLELSRVLAQGGHPVFECRCTPAQASSPFRVLIEFLQRHLQLHPQDPPELRLARLESSALAGVGGEEALPLLASLLDVPIEPRHAPLRLPPEKLRQRVLALLSDWLRWESRLGPVCLLVEDVHWIDPSTQAFLQLLLVESAELPLLLLLTLRGDAAQAPGQQWGGSGEVLVLRGLAPPQAQALIEAACQGQVLPPGVVCQLAERADGVPLFLEESARMALDLLAAGQAVEAGNLSVPATLQDLLMTRLDRLGTAKTVAQLGAVLGREFSWRLLEALADEPALPLRLPGLQAGLDKLLDSGLLMRSDKGPQQLYSFKHALVRDAAYQSLWERDRRRLHILVAQVIAERFPDWLETQPELLALHYSEASRWNEAVLFWERAARLSSSRSAQLEALAHVRRGLQLVPQLSPGPERERQELRLQLLLAGRLIATEGYGADGVERVYARALALCQQLDDRNALLKVLLGLEGFHFMRADFARAEAIVAQAMPLALSAADPMPALQLRWAQANLMFHRGQLVDGIAVMDACLADYGRLRHRPSSVQDPGIMCQCYTAWGLWELGRPDQALQRAQQVVAQASALGHRFSMGEAYGFATTVHFFRGEYRQALDCSEQAIVICEEGGFSVWLAHARLMRGRLLTQLGQIEAGLALMRRGYAQWTDSGAVVTRSFYLAMQAEGLSLADRPEQGLSLLAEALALVARHGERYYEPELLRLDALLRRQAGLAGPEAVEMGLRQALLSAQTLGLCSLALRAATALADHCRDQARVFEALTILNPAYDAISEGRNTADLLEAGRLREALGIAVDGADRETS